MHSLQSSTCVVSIKTSDKNILRAWDCLVDMLKLAKIEFSSDWGEYLNGKSWNSFTVTMTLNELNGILVKISDSLQDPSEMILLTERVVSQVLWQLLPPFLTESPFLGSQRTVIRKHLKEGLTAEEVHRTEGPIKKPVLHLNKDLSDSMKTIPGFSKMLANRDVVVTPSLPEGEA